MCLNDECGRIDEFDGQSIGLLNMKLFCVTHELLRHHMYQFLLGRYNLHKYPDIAIYFYNIMTHSGQPFTHSIQYFAWIIMILVVHKLPLYSHTITTDQHGMHTCNFWTLIMTMDFRARKQNNTSFRYFDKYFF